MVLFRKKRVEKQVTHKSIVAGLAERFGTDLITAVEYGREPSLQKLTGCEPSLFLVISDSLRDRIPEIKSFYSNENSKMLFVLTETEAVLLPFLFPLELIHIRSGYSLLFGEERLLHAEISRDPVTTQLIRELLSLTLQVRSLIVTGSSSGNLPMINVLRRLIPVVKGLLSLRVTTIPVDWASLVSDLESSYNLKQFPLSGIVATLEKNSKSSLDDFYHPLLQVIDDLRNQLIHVDGSAS